MSLVNIPGFIGYQATRVSSFDGRAIGKFTDTNHLYSLHAMEPSEYDKKIITLYTQTSQYSNDFLQMINQSTPLMIDNEYWQWKIGVPYRYPTIIEIPASTLAMSTPGIAGQVFEIVLDKKSFFKNQHITADRRYGQQFFIVDDPTPYHGRGWLYKCTLVTPTPMTDYVSSTWLTVGLNMQEVEVSIGEFDQEMPGLPEMAQTISLYETMAAGFGFEHSLTKWASQLSFGQDAKNVMVYTKYQLNEVGQPKILDMRWESYIETLMRKHMMDLKVKRFIWSKPGTVKTNGSMQEIKKSAEGLYWKMRNYGNRVTYNRGEFSLNILRSVFGDLFYRREDIQDRKVKIYTNEAGMDVISEAIKKDALGSNLVFNAGDSDKFVQGSGQNLSWNMRFNKFYTIETGWVEYIHLKELDQPQTNEEFGQNKKSTPVYMVFDISSQGDGTPKNNIREVRLKGAPSMTWGYINGRQHYQGHAASQGMISSSMSPTTKVWMEDRCDIFVEDLSRMVLIEENPQY